MATPTPPIVTHLPWGLFGLLRVLLAIGLAGVVAEVVLAPGVLPADVFAPVSLLFAGYAGSTWRMLQVLALLLVVSGLAAVIVRRPGDAGLLAAALAVGFLTPMRPGAPFMLIESGSGPYPLSAPAIYAELATESLVWALLLVGVWFVGRFVETRFFNQDNSLPAVDVQNGQRVPAPPAVCWVPEPLAGAKGALITLLVGVVALYVLGQTVAPRQVVFATWFSLFLATLVAHRTAAFRMAIWPLLALAVIMIGGYVLAFFEPVPQRPFELLTNLPPNRWTYPTPAQYAAFGGLGVVTGIWFSQRLHRLETIEKYAGRTTDPQAN